MSKRKFIEKINDAFMSSELCTFLVLTHQQYNKSVSNSTKLITAKRNSTKRIGHYPRVSLRETELFIDLFTTENMQNENNKNRKCW